MILPLDKYVFLSNGLLHLLFRDLWLLQVFVVLVPSCRSDASSRSTVLWQTSQTAYTVGSGRVEILALDFSLCMVQGKWFAISGDTV